MEQALMLAHHRKGIDGMKALLPGHTRRATFARAGKMGLTETRLWQSDEDDLLRELYPALGISGVREKLPHRTISWIKHRVKFLG
ncbi:hypothetical protein MUA02_12485 [Enterobacteriaceae bacterium H20N1]|uniref:Uncharacterized protein n=1 Tax=Dryocola boscaweniae TaxID=2925397 RepID=A0A9X3ABN4_9ENTR|nr:hypothetical protein [Dryocola boscaweniae]MCT4702679.1 hypothetical protein [Dryocola boscaweniae]MCT4719847.1 hypothetical protein [Dryocola boscaweniae]